MRKGLLALTAALLSLSLTGCVLDKDVEKEYIMTLQSPVEVIDGRLKDDETEHVELVYCKRSLSAYNYYIQVPEGSFDAFTDELPTKLRAKKTNNTTKYLILVDKKSKTVSDHGYEFIRWEE